ncbi:MAG: response regulator [Bryobacteraceae bacterium]|jgi:DNA-binding response OmpR family regulator
MEERTAKKILIVDDESDVLAYLGAFFADSGFSVSFATDGKEGFEKAKAEHPDLITLDITMPEESGVRMFRNLQEDAETAGIPVVILTGVSHDFKRFIETRSQVHPPAGYFDKPPDREQLLAKIREILGAPRP